MRGCHIRTDDPHYRRASTTSQVSTAERGPRTTPGRPDRRRRADPARGSGGLLTSGLPCSRLLRGLLLGGVLRLGGVLGGRLLHGRLARRRLVLLSLVRRWISLHLMCSLGRIHYYHH